MPNLQCVACSLSDKRCKLLRCLHALCVGCLETFISSENTVSCPVCSRITPSPGEGRTQLASLPDSASSSAIEPSASQGFSCDECMQETVAIATCGDCKLNFCDLHAKSHQQSRFFSGHHMSDLPASSGRNRASGSGSAVQVADPIHRCALHSRQAIVQYCRSCSELLCSICATDAKHRKHADSLLSVGDADKIYRKELRSTVESSTDDGSSVLSRTVEKIGQEIAAVHQQTEDASEAVHSAVASAVKALKERENKLLDELDCLRHSKVVPLEKQLGQLQTHVNAGELVTLFMSDCTDAVNVLRMWTWLKEATVAQAKAAESTCGPCRSSRIGVAVTGFSDLAEHIGHAGRIHDLDVCAEKSKFTCPQSCAAESQLSIAITAVGVGGEMLSNDDAKQSGLQVKVVEGSSGKAHVCELSGVNDKDQPVATFVPHGTGNLTVSVRSAAGAEFQGSPVTVVVNDIAFSSSQKNQSIILSDDKRTARVSVNRWVAACGATVHAIGQVVYRVRMDMTPKSSIVVGMSCALPPLLDCAYPNSPSSLFAWYDLNSNFSQRHNGGSLGQPWKKGDVIRLTLDCDKHELTGCHVPSGATETLTVPAIGLYLFCSMYGNSPDERRAFAVSLV